MFDLFLRNGRIIDKDAGYVAAVGRMMGFTTANSAKQWAATHLMRLEQDHATMLRSAIVRRMAQAHLEGDRELLRRMARDVASINRDILRSGAPRQYLIRNVGQSVRKAIQEGYKPLFERDLREGVDHFDFAPLRNAMGLG